MNFIIKKFFIIILLIISFQTYSSKLFSATELRFDDFGLISIMYHRFDEEKYPSTNIQLAVFKEQLEIIDQEGIKFIHPKDFEKSLSENKNERKVLLTIDDGLSSFYENAWPILKERKIPFILFVNTREVGAYNYMNWDQIIELHKNENVEIGNHSHSHEYLVEETPEEIKMDIITSREIFKKNWAEILSFFPILLENIALSLKKLFMILVLNMLLGNILG